MFKKLFSLIKKNQNKKIFNQFSNKNTFPYIYENEFNIKFLITNEIEEYRTKYYGHEKDFVISLYNELNYNDVFYDVGSSVGLISMFASKKVTSGQVVSFEPDTENLKALRENFRINNLTNFIIHEIAIGCEKTKLNLYTNGSNDKSPSLRKVNNIDNCIEVEVNSIDNLISEGLIRPTVIKIDVEGAEFLVLKGMKNLLNSQFPPRLLIIEIHPDFLVEFNNNEEEIYDFISSFGYNLVNKIERDNQILCSYKYNFQI